MLKQELLETFKEDGYWLLALSELPCTLSDEPLEAAIPSLLQRLDKQVEKQVPVILIQSSLYDMCYAPLVAKGFNVRNARIPFPGSGQQRVFRKKFQAALEGDQGM